MLSSIQVRPRPFSKLLPSPVAKITIELALRCFAGSMALSFPLLFTAGGFQVRWTRRIASKCRGSKQQQQQALTGTMLKSELRFSAVDGENKSKARLQARNTLRGEGFPASSMPFDKDSSLLKSRWILPEAVENGERTWTAPEYTYRESSKASFGIGQVARNGVGANEDSSNGEVGRDVDMNDDVGEEKSAAFEQWAANKLEEDGPSALPAIEEMRQTFAPGSPRLGPRMGLSDTGLQKNVSVKGNAKYNQTISLSSPTAEFAKTGKRLEGVRHLAAVLGRVPTSGVESRSRTKLDPLSSNSTANSREQSESNPVPKTRVSFSTERTGNTGGESSTAGQPDSSVPQPLLVKRKTKLPVNWNGRAGSVMLVDKPQGWTSFAVCAKLRYLLKIQKVGHAGTLDPMATGLLIVCLGKATKLADSYQALTKVYSGTIRLGELTPSLDSFTEVSDVLPWEHITDEQLERAKQDFIGDIFQKPPMYSAIKVDGERLYKKARRGETIEVPARLVSVIDFQLRRSSETRQDIHFRVRCSKGTYVRSLCADLASSVGSYAHLTALRREKIGTYSVKDAWPILEFMEQWEGSQT